MQHLIQDRCQREIFVKFLKQKSPKVMVKIKFGRRRTIIPHPSSYTILLKVRAKQTKHKALKKK